MDIVCSFLRCHGYKSSGLSVFCSLASSIFFGSFYLLLLFPSFPLYSDMNKWFKHDESVLTSQTWWQCPSSSALWDCWEHLSSQDNGVCIYLSPHYWFLHVSSHYWYFEFLLFSNCQFTSPCFNHNLSLSTIRTPCSAVILLPIPHFINMVL